MNVQNRDAVYPSADYCSTYSLQPVTYGNGSPYFPPGKTVCDLYIYIFYRCIVWRGRGSASLLLQQQVKQTTLTVSNVLLLTFLFVFVRLPRVRQPARTEINSFTLVCQWLDWSMLPCLLTHGDGLRFIITDLSPLTFSPNEHQLSSEQILLCSCSDQLIFVVFRGSMTAQNAPLFPYILFYKISQM